MAAGRLLAVVLVVLVVLAGVLAVVLLNRGASSTSTTSTTLSLTVQVGRDEASLHTDHATLECDGSARGTGYLGGSGPAARACRAVAEGRVQQVERAQASKRLCSMIYGGPQTARITGKVSGARVDLTVDRTDGCGVSDWELLQPLLGDPGRAA